MTVPDQETGALQQRRLVSIADKARLTERAQQQHSDRAKAEQNRLWYVALTRASHRVYAVMQDAQAKSQDALAYWKHQGEAFFIPIAWMNRVSHNAHRHYIAPRSSKPIVYMRSPYRHSDFIRAAKPVLVIWPSI